MFVNQISKTAYFVFHMFPYIIIVSGDGQGIFMWKGYSASFIQPLPFTGEETEGRDIWGYRGNRVLCVLRWDIKLHCMYDKVSTESYILISSLIHSFKFLKYKLSVFFSSARWTENNDSSSLPPRCPFEKKRKKTGKKSGRSFSAQQTAPGFWEEY